MTGKELQSLADNLAELARKAGDKSREFSDKCDIAPRDEHGDVSEDAMKFHDIHEDFDAIHSCLKDAFRYVEYAANHLKKIEAKGESL